MTALAGLFVAVLRLCQAAGLVKLGQVALDGTKIKANASKHKAMSYARMEETERRLEGEVQALLQQAEQVDATEDAEYGRGRRGDELPAELAGRETRLAKIRAAKAALEQEARAQAAAAAEAAQAKLAAREARVDSAKGGLRKIPDPEQARPEPDAQRNFTDPDSRIMVDRAPKSYEQAYNAQAAVDGQAQVIVACGVTQSAAAAGQFVPMFSQAAQHLGQAPAVGLADAGYFSEANRAAPERAGVALYVPPDRQSHGGSGRASRAASPLAAAMRAKLPTAEGYAHYALRKAIVEPVFGQIKEARGFRRFSFRGVVKVTAEWALICLTHNLLKLFRAQQPGLQVA